MKLATRQFTDVSDVRSSLKRGGSNTGTAWVKNIPAEGITVRFLAEPDQWFGYFEYWDNEARTFVPMAEGEILPDGSKASFRYLTNAVDTSSDVVLALKLPKSAANSLMMKYDKYDTVMDRDYELDKHGEGLDTTYEVTPTAPSPRALDKYKAHDLEEVLLAARRSALGESDVEAADVDPFDDEDIDEDGDSPVALEEMSKKELAKLFESIKGAGSADELSRSDLLAALVDELEI